MAKVQYKVGSYYMNNREIFINAVNALFEPYREQILDDTTQITCDNIGSDASKFSLLIHQMVVRDYMNLYSPYRGLLLYHGLGSGKTCTSIALAEGMKSGKKIIIMTPASLRPNYISELKKCGDALYKTNQYWEWIDIVENPEAIPTLSSILNLSVDYINANGGAWLVNVTKPKPYPILSPTEKTSLDNQINEMIESKYKFINYNGLRRSKLKEMTNNFEVNLFDDAVIVIDEAHNLISRIVNKLGKEKPIPIDDRTGLIEKRPLSLALNLYQDLLSAKNAKVILLTGTPIINYPNEVAILFNILRGYIKQWEFTLDIKSSSPVNDRTLHDMFIKERLLTMDYLEYSSTTKKMAITRNPFGFENNIKKLKSKEKDEKYHGVSVSDQNMSDEEFERNWDSARQESSAAFGNDGIYMEKYVEDPRHIEIQLAGDQYGNVCHLSERDCSIQRRHQKLVEEAPSPFITPELREIMGDAAIKGAKSINYEGLGTIEFLVDKFF
jgi:hypothetical protein